MDGSNQNAELIRRVAELEGRLSEYARLTDRVFGPVGESRPTRHSLVGLSIREGSDGCFEPCVRAFGKDLPVPSQQISRFRAEAVMALELYQATLAIKEVAEEIDDLNARHEEASRRFRAELESLTERLDKAKEVADEKSDALKEALSSDELPASYLVGEGTHVVIVEADGSRRRTRIMPLKT